jgi:hypothetical protein
MVGRKELLLGLILVLLVTLVFSTTFTGTVSPKDIYDSTTTVVVECNKSVAYYLKVLNASLLGANVTDKPCGTADAGATGAGTGGATATVKPINFSTLGTSVNDNELLCLYYIENANDLITETSSQVPVSGTSAGAPASLNYTTFLSYPGGKQQVFKGVNSVDNKTYFYVAKSGSSCIGNGGSTGKIAADCTIFVSNTIWNKESYFKVLCAGQPARQYVSNGKTLNAVGIQNAPPISNLDTKAFICYPGTTPCLYSIGFNADTSFDNELFVYTFKKN